LTVSLIAVLIPLLFMQDVVGRLFREFAVTLAVTILISAVVSLTLVPMMCAKLLKHRPRANTRRSSRTVVQRHGRVVRPEAHLVLDHQRLTCTWRPPLGADRDSLYSDSEGFLPAQDNRPDSGLSEAAQSISYAAMAIGTGARGRDHQDPDVLQPHRPSSV